MIRSPEDLAEEIAAALRSALSGSCVVSDAQVHRWPAFAGLAAYEEGIVDVETAEGIQLRISVEPLNLRRL